MITALLALIGAIVGVFAARFAARRAAVQPTDAYPEDEKQLLRRAVLEPGLVTGLESHDVQVLLSEGLTVPLHREVLAALWQCRDEADVLAGAKANLGIQGKEFIDAAADSKCSTRDFPLLVHEFVQIVKERHEFTGSSPVRFDPEVGLIREHRDASRTRQIIGALFVAGGFSTAVIVSTTWWGLLLGLVAVATGAVLAFVDHDTLKIDYLTYFSGLAVSGALVVLGPVLSQDLSALARLGGTLFILFGATFLSIAAAKLRGIDGIVFGGGDFKLYVIVVGTTALITDSIFAGLVGFLLAAIVQVGSKISRVLCGKARWKAREALALGPALVVAMPASWVVYELVRQAAARHPESLLLSQLLF